MAKFRGSAIVGGLSGTSGPMVFVRRADGAVIVRERVVPRDPGTPAQLDNRRRMGMAAAAFRDLDPDEMQAWADYARRLSETRTREGLGGTPSAQNLFAGLAVRFLHASPGGSVPRRPPETDFTGDGIALRAEAIAGGVRFTASGPNSAGVTTELLLQPLRTSASGRPLRAYRHRGYAAFASGSLSAEVAAANGWMAAGARFVRLATGQASPVVEIGVVKVG